VVRPDLNIDLGELPDEPEELYRLAHRVNVACGGHAGDEPSMRLACRRARAAGATLGAHPSFEDRANFGRLALAVEPADLRRSVARQCAALRTIGLEESVAIAHVKPHGALYHAANADPLLAAAVVEGALDVLGPVAIVGPPWGALSDAAGVRGLAFLREGFADRGYSEDGTLLPRGTPGALLSDPALATEQARRLAASKRFDTLCVHGDTPHAVEVARAVRAALEGA
jgi:5-oxoprolinase (ATP-hydrolysing) subunit A